MLTGGFRDDQQQRRNYPEEFKLDTSRWEGRPWVPKLQQLRSPHPARRWPTPLGGGQFEGWRVPTGRWRDRGLRTGSLPDRERVIAQRGWTTACFRTR